MSKRPTPGQAERSAVSLSCAIVIQLARLVGKLGFPDGVQVPLSVAIVSLLPLALTVPAALSQKGPPDWLNRAFFAVWPSLLALAPTVFAWQAAQHLLDSEVLATRLFERGRPCEHIKQWRSLFTPAKQIVLALPMGCAGAIAGFAFVLLLDVDILCAALGALSLLISGFVGGLGFCVGACSPALTRAISKCDLILYPFAPATTPEIKEIAWNCGKIVYKGMIGGVVLSTPLLYLAARYTLVSLRSLLVLAIVPAWLMVFWVLGMVQYHLQKIISKTQLETRRQLQEPIKNAYQTLDHATDGELSKLQHLLELDRVARTSGRFAVDARVLLQGALSLAISLIPLLIELLARP